MIKFYMYMYNYSFFFFSLSLSLPICLRLSVSVSPSLPLSLIYSRSVCLPMKAMSSIMLNSFDNYVYEVRSCMYTVVVVHYTLRSGDSWFVQ